MLRLPRFTLVAAHGAREAATLVGGDERAMLVAGGTDLFPNMKRRQATPSTLVSLAKVPGLAGIRNGTGLRIGALTTLATVVAPPNAGAGYAALAPAPALVSTPQLRNMGTLGGNLCLDTRCNWYDQSAFWRAAEGYCMKTNAEVVCRVAPSSRRCLAVASADTVPALLVLGAKVRITGASGEREADLGELYREDGIRYLTLARGEVVTEIVLPPTDGWRSTYLKMRDRGSFDFPIAGVAAAIRMEGGRVAQARVALTALGSQPELVAGAAAAIVGTAHDDAANAAAAAACHTAARPMDNTSGSISQRKRAARVLTERALRELRGH